MKNYLIVKDLKNYLNNLPEDAILVEGNSCSWNNERLSPIESFDRFFTICKPDDIKGWKLGSYNEIYKNIDKVCLRVYDSHKYDY